MFLSVGNTKVLKIKESSALDANDTDNIAGYYLVDNNTANLPDVLSGSTFAGILLTVGSSANLIQTLTITSCSSANLVGTVFNRTYKDEALSEWIKIISEKDNENASSGDAFSIVDINTKDCTSAGTLSTDTFASKGKSYQLTTNGTAQNLYTGTFSDVNFGSYALCLRLKVSSANANNTFTVKVLNGTTVIKTIDIAANRFDSTNNFCDICTTFDYAGTSSAKQALQLQVLTNTASSSNSVRFDYAYISLLTPAIYI